MPWPFRRGRTVTIQRYTVDKRTQERALADPQPTALTRCAYDPGGVRVNADGSSTVQSPRFFGPYAADVQPADVVTIAGIDGEFEVEDEPKRWRNDLTAREHCCEVGLVRKRGAV